MTIIPRLPYQRTTIIFLWKILSLLRSIPNRLITTFELLCVGFERVGLVLHQIYKTFGTSL